MVFKKFGDNNKPTIIILHGGGLSSWAVEPIVKNLTDNFHIITPIIDGHGEDGANAFTTIRECSNKLLNFIDKNHLGSIHALCGLSIGAQIVLDVLGQREDICKFSIIESAHIIPQKIITKLLLPMIKLSYPLIKKRWYSDIQAKFLLLPENLYENYYIDSCKISKITLLNIIRENGFFELNTNVVRTRSKVLILYGEKEIESIKKSGKLLKKSIPFSEVLSLPNFGHGELSQLNPKKYSEILLNFISTV